MYHGKETYLKKTHGEIIGVIPPHEMNSLTGLFWRQTQPSFFNLKAQQIYAKEMYNALIMG